MHQAFKCYALLVDFLADFIGADFTTRTYVRVFMGCLHVSYRYYPILVDSEDLLVRHGMQATINGAQLNLQEAVELQQETLLDVVMEAADGEIFSVLQIGNSLWILE